MSIMVNDFFKLGEGIIKPQAIQAFILICRLWVRYEPQQGIAQIAKPSCRNGNKITCAFDAQYFCLYSRREHRRMASDATVSATKNTDKKTSQIIVTSLQQGETSCISNLAAASC